MDDLLRAKLNSYQLPAPAIELIQSTKLVFLVGISGAGKDTVLKRLLASGKYHHIVSHTTRRPRENRGIPEEDGTDYHFIDFETARTMLDNGEFIEAKRYSGNIYGTSVAEIEKANKDGQIAISDIEVQGVAEYRAVAPNVMPIFILPPDYETWQTRLKARYAGGQIDPKNIEKRMAAAKRELEEALAKEYFEFVINDDLDRAVTAVDEIAHGNVSAKKNKEARQIAKELLKKLSA
jgi:guanylate kinase